MSSNSGTIINRANETSPFLNAIKSRNSKSLPELYSAEVNTEPMAQSKVEVESSSASGYSRTLRISLPRYGLLNKLYVHSRFGGQSYTASSSNALQHVPFIGAYFAREYRLMYNGSTIAKLNPETIITDLWKHSSQREKMKLQEMLGAFDQKTSSFSSSASRNALSQHQRSIASTAPDDGIMDFYVPLDFFFSSKLSPNRNLDLSVLANEVLLEIDVESQSNIWKVDGTVGTQPALQNVTAICYLTEMDQETEKQYRSLQYQAGGSPLTQLCFDTNHVIVASNVTHTNSADTFVDVKLNQFVGNVEKLVIYATKTDNYQTNRFRLQPVPLGEIQLKATGSNIVNLDNLGSKEDLLESYHNGGDFLSLNETSNHYDALITCNPNNIYEITFKHPYDFSKVSESGSVAFGQLSIPTLRVGVVGTGKTGFGQGSTALNANFDLHVIAYETALISYNTNTSGSTHIRQIKN